MYHYAGLDKTHLQEMSEWQC